MKLPILVIDIIGIYIGVCLLIGVKDKEEMAGGIAILTLIALNILYICMATNG